MHVDKAALRMGGGRDQLPTLDERIATLNEGVAALGELLDDFLAAAPLQPSVTIDTADDELQAGEEWIARASIGGFAGEADLRVTAHDVDTGSQFAQYSTSSVAREEVLIYLGPQSPGAPSVELRGTLTVDGRVIVAAPRVVTIRAARVTGEPPTMFEEAEASSITSSSATLRLRWSEPVTGYTEIVRVSDGQITQSTAATSPGDLHVQSGGGLSELDPATDYDLTFVATDVDGNEARSNTVRVRTAGTATTSGGGGAAGVSMTWAEIEAAGLASHGYGGDPLVYVAEFLAQNAGVSEWRVTDTGVEAVQEAPIPGAAIELPARTGSYSTDTANVHNAIRANPGAVFVAPSSAPYALEGLVIDRPVTIHGMHVQVGAGVGVYGRADNIELIDCPGVGGKNSSGTLYKLDTPHTGARIIRSGYKDVLATTGVSFAGVEIDNARDYVIACCEWEALYGIAGSADTGRANAVWIRSDQDTADGFIVNNRAEDLIATGTRDDSEFLTIQNASGRTGHVHVLGNRWRDCGKRGVKLMSPGCKAYSNSHEFATRDHPVHGRRKMNTMFNVQQHGRDFHMLNNRFIAAAGSDGRYDSFLSISPIEGHRFDNVHADHNDMLLIAPNGSYPTYLIYGKAKTTSDGTENDLTNSSARHNRVRGAGSARAFFRYYSGFSGTLGMDDTGNVVDAGTVESYSSKGSG